MFTAREYDFESGLYYYRARFYIPSLGRFLTPDPIGFAGGDLNLYRYVKNNPVNFTDPSGNIPLLIGVPIATGLVSGIIGGFGNSLTGGSFARGFGVGFVSGFFGGVGAVTGSSIAAIGGAFIGSAITAADIITPPLTGGSCSEKD